MLLPSVDRERYAVNTYVSSYMCVATVVRMPTFVCQRSVCPNRASADRAFVRNGDICTFDNESRWYLVQSCSYLELTEQLSVAAD